MAAGSEEEEERGVVGLATTNSGESAVNYATFRQRFYAMWADFFVLVPLNFLQGLTEGYSKILDMILFVPFTAAYIFYHVYCHARFGQTIGKHVMGIRVVALDGTRIGWRAAVLRNSVDIAFELISIPCFMMAILSVPDAEYYGGDWIQRGTQIQTYLPSWHQWFFRAGMVWVWSEVFVMLLNKRRRALHDFIAGTIVVQVNPTEKQSQSA